MELKIYLHILIKMWWVVVLILCITLIATISFTMNQPRIYESRATFVVRPQTSVATDRDELARAVDTLSRRTEINTTYAEVAQSKLIRQRAIERLDLPKQQASGLTVLSRVVAGTNILEITARGKEPNLVQDFADAVSQETQAYVRTLYDAFALEPLDAAGLPSRPISPNIAANLILGSVLGLMLGVMWAFFIEYLRHTGGEVVTFNILDPDTTAFNAPYLMLRLRQEMSRAERNGYALSLVLFKVTHQMIGSTAMSWDRSRILRAVSTIIKLQLRDEDVLALYEHATLALLLPDVDGVSAQVLANNLKIRVEQEAVVSSSDERLRFVQVTAGVVTLNETGVSAEEFVARAEEVLQSSTLYSPVNSYPKVSNGYPVEKELYP